MLARRALVERGANIVIARRGMILFAGWSRGLKDLAKIALESRGMLNCSSVADRIVGKAAAIIFSANGVEAVYALTLSRHALEELERSGIKLYYERLVPHIEAPSGGICPFEKLVMNIADRDEAYRRLIERFRELGWG
jgi:hypothetical protein